MQHHSSQQAARQDQLVAELERDVQRLQFAAHRAEQQYDNVDPKNRLIAASLESKWETSMQALASAQENLKRVQVDPPQPVQIPMRLRESFGDIGKQMPSLWPDLSPASQRALLRTLVSQVNLLRDSDGNVEIRIVWQGRLVSEHQTRLRSFSLRGTEVEARLLERIRHHSSFGLNSDSIAKELNQEGLVPCRGERFTAGIVTKLKARFGIVSNFVLVRRGNLPFAWTTGEVAKQIGRSRSWVSRQIINGRIRITINSRYGCYLFPKNKSILDSIRQLRDETLEHVDVPEVQTNG